MESREVPKKISRRKFLKGIAVAVGAVGWTTLAGFTGKEILDQKKEWESPIGEAIDNEEEYYQVDSEDSILREEPRTGKTPYWVPEKGIIVKCRKVYGEEYATVDSRLTVKKGSRFFGVWYEFLDPVKVKDKDGNLIEVKGYMSGNFLEKLTEEEVKKLNLSS
jgi:hypothetical protein